MGLAITALFLLALAGGSMLLAQRSREHKRELRSALDEALNTAAARCTPPETVQSEGEQVTLSGGKADALVWHRLLAVADRGYLPVQIAQGALELLRAPLRPLAGPFSLKIHGTRVRLHFYSRVAMALRTVTPKLALTPFDELGLIASYRIDGRADQCLTEDHLQQQGIDSRDLHRIALAVLGQQFDADLPRRVLATGEPQQLRSDDGSAAAAILVIADFLQDDETINARLAGPDALWLTSSTDRWRDASTKLTAETLELVIDSRGYRIR